LPSEEKKKNADNNDNSHRVHHEQDTEHSEGEFLDSSLLDGDDDSFSDAKNKDHLQNHEDNLKVKKEYGCQGPRWSGRRIIALKRKKLNLNNCSIKEKETQN